MAQQILEKPVEAAKLAECPRQDFDIRKDLILFISMLGGSLTPIEVSERKALAKRALQFLLEGINTKR